MIISHRGLLLLHSESVLQSGRGKEKSTICSLRKCGSAHMERGSPVLLCIGTLHRWRFTNGLAFVTAFLMLA